MTSTPHAPLFTIILAAQPREMSARSICAGRRLDAADIAMLATSSPQIPT